jgi:hypothetical protein
MSGYTSITFAPAFPWLVLAAMALAAAVLLAFGLWRRAPGLGWRALAFAALLLALVNPSLTEEQREPLADVAVIVVDESGSQEIGEREERTAEAVAHIRERLEAYKDLDLRVVPAGAATAGGIHDNGTRLFEALERALSDTPHSRIAGAVLVTDGQVHDAPADPAAWAFKAPLHVVLTGKQNEADRRLVVVQAPRYGIVGENLSLTLRVEDNADLPANARARITLRHQGAEPQRFDMRLGVDQDIPFTLTHAGQTVIEIEAAAGPSELTMRNNRAVVVVNGVRDRLRVLLVSGEPHAGERTWRNLLKADPSVDLVHFTILRPPEKQDGTPINELSLIAFPIRELFEVKLDEFDLVIFDRYRRRGVLPLIYLNNVAEYVRRGGAILEAAGPAFATPLSLYRTPLETVLPGQPSGAVFEAGFKPRLTGEGRRHPVTASLPGAGKTAEDAPEWGRWFRMVEVSATSGHALMNGAADRPVLLLDRVGDGRVAQLLSDHAWLWARGFEGGGPQAELLRRLAHWLMKEPDLEENVLRGSARGSRLEIVRRSIEPDTTPVVVTDPTGKETEVVLQDLGDGRAMGTLAVEEPGLYRLRDAAREAFAAVGSTNPLEYSDVRTTTAPLAPVVRARGGALVWATEDGLPEIRRIKPGRDAAGRGWIGFAANRDYVVTGVRQVDMLPPVVLLLAIIGLLITAWRREGR